MTKLLETDDGLLLGYLDLEETEFLYHEVFTLKSYLSGFSEGARNKLERTAEPTIVDVGSNIGLFSLFCLVNFPYCSLIGIEPNPAAFQVLQTNIRYFLSQVRRNASRGKVRTKHEQRVDQGGPGCCEVVRLGLPRRNKVSLRSAMAGEKSGVASLTCFDDRPGESTRHPCERERMDSIIERYRKEQGISDMNGDKNCLRSPSQILRQVATLSEIFDDERNNGVLARCQIIDILKVDCEGDELLVLHGIRDDDWMFLQNVVVEVHDVDGRLKEVVNLLSRKGFRTSVESQAREPAHHDDYQIHIPKDLNLYLVFAEKL